MVDKEAKDQFKDIIQRRCPGAIAIGDFSLITTKLPQRAEKMVGGKQPAEQLYQASAASAHGDLSVPIIYAQDGVSQVFQHSRCVEEFDTLSTVARYAVGLAQCVRSPLIECAAIGSDITAIAFNEDSSS